MEAKDTVISDEQIIQLKAEAYKLAWSHKAHPRFEQEKHLLAIQAEISFKAGQKEVVDWVERHKTQSVSALCQSAIERFSNHDQGGPNA